MTRWKHLTLAAMLVLVLCAGATAAAQRGGGPPGGGGGGGQGPGSGGGQPGGGNPFGGAGNGPGNSGSGSAGGRGIPSSGGASRSGGGARGAMGSQLGPVGRWWDDKKTAQALNLRPDQKQRMDSVFNTNRAELAGRYQELKTQEAKLEEATRETKTNGGGIFSQIDRVAEAREALAATSSRMNDALRRELDADQIAKLQAMK